MQSSPLCLAIKADQPLFILIYFIFIRDREFHKHKCGHGTAMVTSLFFMGCIDQGSPLCQVVLAAGFLSVFFGVNNSLP